ncbi:MAG TPA: hypothetical protein V6D18_05435 [Thermosynechococcaceae cyanobacterium]
MSYSTAHFDRDRLPSHKADLTEQDDDRDVGLPVLTDASIAINLDVST